VISVKHDSGICISSNALTIAAAVRGRVLCMYVDVRLYGLWGAVL
jgi:hypothetical protein